MRDLREARMVQNFFQISGAGPTLFGRNGEGDPYYTDGEIDIAILVINGVRQTGDRWRQRAQHLMLELKVLSGLPWWKRLTG